MPNQDNSINYIEFPAVDMESTKQFYGAAFGWEFVDYGPSYASFSGAGVNGGFNLESESSGSHGILVVLYHHELEKIEQKIKGSGMRWSNQFMLFQVVAGSTLWIQTETNWQFGQNKQVFPCYNANSPHIVGVFVCLNCIVT